MCLHTSLMQVIKVKLTALKLAVHMVWSSSCVAPDTATHSIYDRSQMTLINHNNLMWWHIYLPWKVNRQNSSLFTEFKTCNCHFMMPPPDILVLIIELFTYEVNWHKIKCVLFTDKNSNHLWYPCIKIHFHFRCLRLRFHR